MRQKNPLEYLRLWERLHNPNFKRVEFDPLMAEAGSNAFTMSPTKWIESTNARNRKKLWILKKLENMPWGSVTW